MKKTMAGMFVMFMLSGCRGVEPYSPPKIYGEFEGIKSLANKKSGSVHIIAVHGMSTHHEGWISNIRDGLEEGLQLQPNPATTRIKILLPDNPVEESPWLSSYQYSYGNRSIFFHELTWSPITTPLKEKFLGYDKGAAYKEKRALFNSSLKESFVDDGLSDVALYLGAKKKVMQSAVEQALCYALANFPKGNYCELSEQLVKTSSEDQIIFITHSLGSRLTVDTLQSLCGSKCGNTKSTLWSQYTSDVSDQKQQRELLKAWNAQEIMDRMESIYMFANQIPLLEMGMTDKPKAATANNEGINSFMGYWLRGEAAAIPTKKQIVAFSDPNDLLTYTLCGTPFPRISDGDTYKFIKADVIVSNSSTVAGLIENPLDAHVRYSHNKDVMSLVVNGSHGSTKRCEGVTASH